MNFEIVTKPAFKAVGMSWKGTFQQAGAGEIREIMKEMLERVNEISHVVNQNELLGLSNHADPESNRFSHYSVVEVEGFESVPKGMITVEVPTIRYVKVHHQKGENIPEAYTKAYEWVKENGYKLHTDNLTHFEIYQMNENAYSNDPEFTIMIPVK